MLGIIFMRIRANQLTKKIQLPTGDILTILQDINLKIESGEKLSIMGISGSGKSTLLGILAGLDIPTEGKVYWQLNTETNTGTNAEINPVAEVDLSMLNEDGRASLRLNNAGFIFQNFELLPAYTAFENVLLPLELANIPSADIIARNAMIEVGLDHRQEHYPNQLSGGEQQRVAIARAFAIQPKVLFADEPTGNLDQKTGAQIIQLLSNLNEKHKTTLICVTHDPALSEICDTNLHLKEGRLE